MKAPICAVFAAIALLVSACSNQGVGPQHFTLSDADAGGGLDAQDDALDTLPDASSDALVAADTTPTADTVLTQDTTPNADTSPIADATADTAAAPDTASTSDTATPADTTSTPDGSGPPTPTWPMAAIKDPTTANCAFTKSSTALKDGVQLTTWEVSYTSWEAIGGKLKPITIRGFAARPKQAQGKLPGVVQAHGLGGHAKMAHATGLAALTGTFVIAYTGPGGGDAPNNTSEGLASGHDGGKRMFDTIPDIRGSWFWGHAVAAMRGLTCLASHPNVDPGKLGMTGYSAGGVATFLATGQDDRIKAAVPLSGVLAWDEATKSPDAWQHALLKKAGYSIASPRWKKLMDGLIAPSVALAGAKGRVFLVNGSTDEFFPLTAHAKTMAALKGNSGHHNQAIVANYDHGCFGISGVESKAKIEERASLAAKGAQRAWFHRAFSTDKAYAVVHHVWAEMAQVGAATVVQGITPAFNTSTWEVDDARLWFSSDQGLVFGDVQLKCKKPSNVHTCEATTALPPKDSLVWFVAFTFKRKGQLIPEKFMVTSPPQLPKGNFVPKIRSINSCFPSGFP